MPLHSGKGRTVAEALGRVTDYVENPEKTNGGELVTAYQCNPSIADQEFLFSKRQYAVITGRERKGDHIIIFPLPACNGGILPFCKKKLLVSDRRITLVCCHQVAAAGFLWIFHIIRHPAQGLCNGAPLTTMQGH